MKRRLAAILAADIVGSARLMGENEEEILKRIKLLQTKIFEPRISSQDGRIVKFMGDGVLAEFPSVVNAVQAAIDILSENSGIEEDMPEDQKIRLRIGVNLGDIVSEDDDIYGDGVNVAARLEGLADPDGLCISGIAYQGLGSSRANEFFDSGPYEVKNIAEPIRVYRWRERGTTTSNDAFQEVKPTISISEFKASSDKVETLELAAGLQEDISIAIGTVSQLTVVEEQKSIETPRYRLSGGVRSIGDRMRVQCKLVDQFTGVQVWAQRYDRAGDDYFELQDSLAQAIVIDIHTVLGAGSYTNRWQQGTHNFEAWRLSARAFVEFQKYSPDAMERCIAIWDEALKYDPNFPTPRIARSYCRSRIALWAPEQAEELLRSAEEDYEFAVSICEYNDSRPQSLLRAIRIARGDHDGALEAARDGFEREPNNPACRATLAYALLMNDQNKEALDEIVRATSEIRNYPGWFSSIKILGLLFTNDLDGARQEAQETVIRQPDFYPGRPLLAICHAEKGAFEAANELAKEIRNRDRKLSVDAMVASFGLKNSENAERLRVGLLNAGL